VIGDDYNLLKSIEPLPPASPAHAVAFSADGARIALGGGGGEVRVHDAADGKRVATLKGHEGGIFALAFSPDGKTLAAGGFDGKLRLYDVAAQKLSREFIPVPLKEAEVAAGSASPAGPSTERP
jgi:WD40 repeat protein